MGVKMALSTDQRDAIVAAISAVESALDDFAAVGDDEGVNQLGNLLGGLMVACECREGAIKIRMGRNEFPTIEGVDTAITLEAAARTHLSEALAVFGG